MSSALNPQLGDWMTVEEIAAAVVWPVAEVRTLVNQLVTREPFLIAKNIRGYPGARIQQQHVPLALGLDVERWESQRRCWIAAKLSKTEMMAKPLPRRHMNPDTARHVEALRQQRESRDRLIFGR